MFPEQQRASPPPHREEAKLEVPKGFKVPCLHLQGRSKQGSSGVQQEATNPALESSYENMAPTHPSPIHRAKPVETSFTPHPAVLTSQPVLPNTHVTTPGMNEDSTQRSKHDMEGSGPSPRKGESWWCQTFSSHA